MTKKERVLAALKKKPTDRVPFSIYTHSTVHERSVERFAAFTLDFYRRYDPDYIKVMFDDHYDLPSSYDFVRTIDVWRELEEFDPHLGAFGRALAALKIIKDGVGPEVPVIQTIFLPFHFGMRLSYRRLLEDCQRDPETVAAGLTAIARNTVRFGRACLDEAGADGFFFGAYGCDSSWTDQSFYARFIRPLDRLVVDELAAAAEALSSPQPAVTVLHIHGTAEVFFNLLKDYPVKALSWEDRVAGPDIRTAVKLTDKCLVGGVDHRRALDCSPDEIFSQARESIAAAGGRGLILALGCTLPQDTPVENILALKKAVNA